MVNAEMVTYGKNVLKWGRALYDKFFYGAEKEVGRTIKVWKFLDRQPHAKQVFSMKQLPDKTVKTITTCYAGAKAGEKPLVRETMTTLRDGTKSFDIAYINGSNVIRATGSPSDAAVQRVCYLAHGSNPEAKVMLWNRF